MIVWFKNHHIRFLKLTQTLSDVSCGYKKEPIANVIDDMISHILMASNSL